MIFWQRQNILSLESFLGGRPRLKVVGFVDVFENVGLVAGWLNSAFGVASAVCYTLKTFVATVPLRKCCDFP